MKRDKVHCEFPVSAVKGKGQVYRTVECALDRLSKITVDNLNQLSYKLKIDWDEVYFVEVRQHTRDACLGQVIKSLSKKKKFVKRHSVIVHGTRYHWFKPNEEFWYVRRESKSPAAGQTILYSNEKKLGRVSNILKIENKKWWIKQGGENYGPI